MPDQKNFWETTSLEKMSNAEWESLCDGCARCCLVKLQDDETEEVYLTNIACRLLDIESCRCSDYDNRLQKVPMCLNLKTDLTEMLNYLPETCAYRLLSQGETLPEWHPLLSLRTDSVHQAGVSVSGFAVAEEAVHADQIENHIIGSLTNKE